MFPSQAGTKAGVFDTSKNKSRQSHKDQHKSASLIQNLARPLQAEGGNRNLKGLKANTPNNITNYKVVKQQILDTNKRNMPTYF